MEAGADRQQIRQRIRKECLAFRAAMQTEEVRRLSDRISSHILGWEAYQNAKRIYFYYPLGKEVSLLPVIRDALQKDRQVAFPRVSGHSMDFYEITDLGQLEEGCFHVMEPIPNGKSPVEWEDALCFVPGVVFDVGGGRLGYGKGYYDRYFGNRPGVVLAGCAYGSQIVEGLPLEAHDRRMDFLVSEAGISGR